MKHASALILRPQRRHAMALVYILIIWTAMLGFVSFAVDLGRVQLAKTSLYLAADAASRYGVTGLLNGTASARAIQAAGQNSTDLTSVVLQSSDVEIGVWNSATHAFTVTASNPNAVRVTARRTAARGNAIPTPFASMFGWSATDVTAVSVAQIVQSNSVQNTVLGTGDIWLAGMPNGTTANWYDAAPANSPVTFQGVTIAAGASLTISFTGAISNGPSYNPNGPDGDGTWILDNLWAESNGNAEHGISNLTAPICSMVGVFLGASAPNLSAAPASLDFSNASSRDFATLYPQLKQAFFIGDGYRADGTTKQKFVAPTGATRLFIGIMDGYQYSNNSGSLTTTVAQPAVITTVK